MATFRAPRKTTASVVALAVLVATPVGIAVAHPGFPTADVDLYQRAVWVTNGEQGLISLVNLQVRELTGGISVGDPDVVQAADVALALDGNRNQLGLIDAAAQAVPARGAVEPGAVPHLGGATLAVHDVAGGRLWTVPADAPLESALVEESAVDLGSDAKVVVSHDGIAFATSPSEGAVLRFERPGAAPEEIGELPQSDNITLTTVGDRLVIMAAAGDRATISVIGGGTVELSEGPVALQLPGPEAEYVVVATERQLLRIPLNGGEPVAVDFTAAAAESRPIAPAVVRDRSGAICAYGAWAASAEFVLACEGADPAVRPLNGVAPDAELRFRVNRSDVVLNSDNGQVHLVQDDMEVIEAEDWLEVAPPEEEDEAPESDDSTTLPSFDEILEERPETNTPPEARNDDFGVRPGRTTVLQVLENDLDADGDVLTISSISGLPPEVATLDIIDEGRALQITPVSPEPVTRTFSYTVSDGREGGLAQAAVTVAVVPEELENRLPVAQRVTELQLEVGSTISFNVLADWRDPDGDELYLTSVTPSPGDVVRYTPEGLITITHSGSETGDRTVQFTVTDGLLEPGEQPVGELRLQVKPTGEVLPLTVPDFGTTFVGDAVTIDPLVNDSSRSTRELSLGPIEALTPGVQVFAEPDSGDYRFSAPATGTYYLTYTATSGAQESLGVIRLDVLPDPEEVLPPIAVKDTAYLRPNEPLLVPVLLNDVSPSGAVLGVQSLAIVESDRQEAEQAGLAVEVLGGAFLRVSSTGAFLRPIAVDYTISDGLNASTSRVTIVPIPELSRHQTPIARDDRVTVRAGDTATVSVVSNDLHPDGVAMRLNPELLQEFPEGDGVAFVAGDTVRVQAPSVPGTYELVYRVDDDYAEYATARLIVTVTASDGEAAAQNTAPAPTTVTARVQAGGELSVSVPTSGIDIDGDSVTVISATGARLGQIVETGVDGFQYRAGLESGGTEVIRYTVQDNFGAVGQGEVRIGVIPPPETPLPPVAVDDVAEVRPGETVYIPVLDNDSDPANAAFSLEPQLVVTDGVTAEVTGERLVAVTAGEEQGVYLVQYRIANVLGGTSDAFIAVTVTPDARPQPPLASDHVLTVADIVGRDEVEVDLLADAVNPNGDVQDLEIVLLGAGADAVTSVEEGVASIPLTERRQVIAYRLISPETELFATAFVVVPSELSAQVPTLKQEYKDTPIVAPVSESTTWQIRELVDVPSGGQLVIVNPGAASEGAREGETGASVGGGVTAATSGLEDVTTVTETSFTITPREDQRGTGQSITILVTDGITGETSIDIPLTVGDPESLDVAPRFAAPEIRVEVGQERDPVDLRDATTHPNRDIVAAMRYDATVVPAGGNTGTLNVNVSADGVVSASAPSSGGAVPGDQVTIDLVLQADGLLTEPVTAQVVVRVVPSTLPLPQAIDDVRPDGRSSSVYSLPVLDNDFNPYVVRNGEPLEIVDVVFEGDPLGASLDWQPGDVTPTVTTGPAKSGTVTLVYTIQDGSNEVSRQVQGRIVIVVTSAPEPPTFTAAPQRVGSQSLSVSFAPPSSWNGSPELSPAYVVTAYLGTGNTVVGTPRTDCTAGVPCVFTGLTNGTAYSFQVVARNGVGETASSRSAAEIPYGTPSAPTSPSLNPSSGAVANASLTGAWGASADTGGGAVTYAWRFIQGSSGSGSTASTSSFLVTAGAGSYRYEVRACNAGGLCSAWVASNTISVAPAPRIIDAVKGDLVTGNGCPAGLTCAKIRLIVENLSGTHAVCLDGRLTGQGSYGAWATPRCRNATFTNGFADTEFLLNNSGNVGAWDIRVEIPGVPVFFDRIW